MSASEPAPGVTGKVVGPPLDDQDVAELDELARDEQEERIAAEIAEDEGAVEVAGELVELEPPAPFVLVRYVDVAMVLPSTNPVLVLEEESEPFRQLRIPIGAPEGTAIAYAARGIATQKPLTHELMINILEAFALTIDTVRITEVRGAAYSAELVCSGPAGARTLVCRPSDGVALALRQRLPAPILAAPEVLDLAGVVPTGS